MLNSYIIPIIVIFILLYGIIRKNSVYDDFIDGSKDGLKIVIDIIPTMVAMILAINIFVGSGIMEIFKGFYKDIIPMILLRPVSGNATFAILNNIYRFYGVDSFLGFLASVIQGATDTTIYVLALYFGSIGIKKTRYALWVGLFADFCGICAALIVVKYFF